MDLADIFLFIIILTQKLTDSRVTLIWGIWTASFAVQGSLLFFGFISDEFCQFFVELVLFLMPSSQVLRWQEGFIGQANDRELVYGLCTFLS